MSDERATVSPATSVAFQKLTRDRYLDEGTPPVPHLEVGRARVRAVSRRLATRIILKYEWLGTMSSTGAHYGLFFGDYCAGVCCIAINGAGAAGAYGHEQFGIERRELAIFARGACVHWAPKGANSKLISWSLRLLAKDVPHARLCVAYADSDAGEIGTVYQATNWTFIGRSKNHTKNEIVSPEGRVLNVRTLGHYAKKNGQTWREAMTSLEAAGWRQQKSNAKGRYVYVLQKRDAELRARIAELAAPYPKREDSDAAKGRGASTPGVPGRFDSDRAAPNDEASS